MIESLKTLYTIVSAVSILMILIGLSLESKVKTALLGNLLSWSGIFLAIILVLFCYGVDFSHIIVYITLFSGTIIGFIWSSRAQMVVMPQTVALLNGLGGAASLLVAVATLMTRPASLSFESITSCITVLIGNVTFSGSLIAAGKLSLILNSKPKELPYHTYFIIVLLLLIIISAVLGLFLHPVFLILLIIFSFVLGILIVMRIGGADMPITISLLNSFSGIAGGIAGMAVNDPLLVIIGGIVGASGLLLTQAMCKAMNRKLIAVLTGYIPTSFSDNKSNKNDQIDMNQKSIEAPIPSSSDTASISVSPVTSINTQLSEIKAASILKSAKKVIIITGYGMAISQAQSDVALLAQKLKERGVEVKFAIHPVAGRMPGHMSVLLCEADIPYEDLYMMEDINPEFADCDLAISIGANDVTNPAANTAEGTPIYGMPVLALSDAPYRIICCYDLKPGYAGVPNPLFTDFNTLFLAGDAKQSIQRILNWITE